MDDKIINIVIKSLAGEATAEEMQLAHSWKKSHRDEYNVIERIYNSNIFDVNQFDISQIRKEIFEKIDTDTEHDIQKAAIGIGGMWMKIAASIIILLSIGAGIILYNNLTNEHLFSNNSEKTMKVTLPDGSVITLDKHSGISYKNDWLNRFKREVNIVGRAYFVITKNPAHPFRVHAKDITVTVLGTKFTVSDISERIQVVLNEGKVRISSAESDKSFFLSQSGEQIIFLNGNFVKQNRVNKNLYFSWLNEKLHFKYCTVGEAVDFLSDSYDLNINIEDGKTLQKQLFGSAPSDDPNLILKAIAYITDKKITEENGIINLK